jgi:hypothetical protein
MWIYVVGVCQKPDREVFACALILVTSDFEVAHLGTGSTARDDCALKSEHPNCFS